MNWLFSGLRRYVRWVDAVNDWMGKGAMYLIFVMMGILLFSTISRSVFDTPHIWVMEMAQFTMAAYYMLGGGFTLKDQAHVRMDVIYERWSPRAKAWVDCFTALILIFYLCILLWGGISSTMYALEFGQKNYTSWGPPLAPIKILMTLGIILMLLQSFSMLFRDVLFLKEGSKEVKS